MRTIKTTRYQSPVGELIVGASGDKLCLCDWALEQRSSATCRRICRHLNAEYEEGITDTIDKAAAQLNEYFEGIRTEFTIPVQFAGSDFQCRVWSELMKIPYATTVSYAELARRIGNPKAVRAVASAIAANPVSILVPCHRVIGSNRRLTGYAGGIVAKEALLDLETRAAGSMYS